MNGIRMNRAIRGALRVIESMRESMQARALRASQESKRPRRPRKTSSKMELGEERLLRDRMRSLDMPAIDNRPGLPRRPGPNQSPCESHGVRVRFVFRPCRASTYRGSILHPRVTRGYVLPPFSTRQELRDHPRHTRGAPEPAPESSSRANER